MAAFSWMLCEGILVFIMIKLVFYDGFVKKKVFFFMVGWGEYSKTCNCALNILLLYTGLPLPIVIISAAVSHEHYGVNER